VLQSAVGLLAPVGQEALQTARRRAIVAIALLLLGQNLAELDDVIFAFHSLRVHK
jgi:hypothetical protein